MTNDDTLDRLTAATHQLLQLYPRLRDALAKDQTGGDGRSSASPVPSIPVNPDVLESIRQLSADIPTFDADLRTALLFDRATTITKRSVEDCLTYADALWRRLNAHEQLSSLANEYARSINGWLRTARLAVGLTTHPKPIGHPCPFCDGNLHLCGDEAHLHDPDDIEAITWERGELIYCDQCQREWPSAVWDVLGNIIDMEQRRHAEAEAS